MAVVLHNRLEGVSGGVVPSVVGPDGVPVNTPVFAAGKFGNGVDANNSGKYVSLTPDIKSTDLTLEFWVKAGGNSGTQPDYSELLGSGLYSAGNIWIPVFMRSTNRIFIDWAWRLSGTKEIIYEWNNPYTWSTGDKFHLRITYNQSTLKCYFNGNELTVRSSSGTHWTGIGNFAELPFRAGHGAGDSAGNVGNFVIDNFIAYDTILATFPAGWDNEYPYSSRRRLRPLIIS